MNLHFHRHAEATTAELFYDLFFVANLTTFTSLLDINDLMSLTSYIGFFSLLWLTWYQVSLYDVRFSADSIFERCAKCIHFGTMVGFAVMAPQWKPGYAESDYTVYRGFSLILMVSRLTLVAQYGITLWFTKSYTKTRLPLMLVMASSLVAASIYGCLTMVFPTYQLLVPETIKGYIAWYVVGICETLITVAVSCIFRSISFKGTHMVQRMSLLTLIILGEGIIVICKSISKIVENDYLWTAPVVGQIISAILCIYFLYMLYFDRLQEEHFGTIRQQIWTFLHFPLHAVFVLVLQGVANFIIWRQAIQSLNFYSEALSVLLSQPYNTGKDLATALNETAWSYVFDYVPKDIDASKDIKAADIGLKAVALYYANSQSGNETAVVEFATGLQDFVFASGKTIMTSLSIKTPDQKDQGKNTDPAAQFDGFMDVFELVFTYVFVTGGLALILTSVLSMLSFTPEQRRALQYFRQGLNFLLGLGLCLLSTMKYTDASGKYASSPWMIPTLCIVFFICLVVNHVRIGEKDKAH
ncbi:hypothetical protein GQ43DRAFT_412506 [Delitschia confertaspora ATCC 74209]|uniref:Low temperature requirement protein LtrA n=1 Tax=Delitschia confertaspora ATCC 74209 TaxID=1513339 RepID=A0A9P4N0M7_9PLEO|nr:hypothetical protein GQ43DRAFT_412506 [Delitschia confertaspora ATCC 74209]